MRTRALLAALLVAAAISQTMPATAQAAVSFNLFLPGPVLVVPPVVAVAPGPPVYYAPQPEVDVYFSDGWWWRPYGGRWYRSHRHDGPWYPGWDPYGNGHHRGWGGWGGGGCR